MSRRKDGTKITVLYEKLSKDEELSGENNSITNQEKICQGGIHTLKIQFHDSNSITHFFKIYQLNCHQSMFLIPFP